MYATGASCFCAMKMANEQFIAVGDELYCVYCRVVKTVCVKIVMAI